MDSTITSIGKGVVKMNPFRSRSTILCLACLLELFGINVLAWRAGFFSSEFALVSVYIIKEILVSTATHQKDADSKVLQEVNKQT